MVHCIDTMSVWNKQHAVSEFLTAENDIHQQMKVVYVDDCVEISSVQHWAACLHDADLGHASLSEKQHSRRPWNSNRRDSQKLH
jgi:hypothetical protein